MTDQDTIQELIDIKEEIKDLAERALSIIQNESDLEYERAKSYWYAHIVMALDDDHGFLGGSMIKMENSINSLSKQEEEW